ncbi:pyridoxine/pyridoxamine 5'-phosphate oxidase [Drosophila innubila]|uniref:pyridoxine/pyridoxamine 5'-phosphate oxidase n=1 Tax=Drosophila innubila TaxID=198719 RepID=UPI00148C62B8|nr:pyridoxine/pyridoxamine 5'-phosphate oxidase [Drosophila innubila]
MRVRAHKQRIRIVTLSTNLLSFLSKQGPIRNGSTALPQRKLCEENLAIREPYSILHRWLLAAQQQVPQCKPRVACVATVDAAGQPVTRLTNVEQINPSGITFYTALGSRQAGEISNNPHVSLHFHWPQMDRSVHISGIASPVCALQAERQFGKYPRQVQLSMHGIQLPKLILGISIYDKVVKLLIKLFGKQVEEIPAPHNWGGFQLKPTLYEFFDSSRGFQDTQCMRFRRCLTLPRGMRNRTLNADRYDWVFDRGIDHDN